MAANGELLVIREVAPDQFADLLKLRTDVFVNEAVSSGIPRENVEQHVAGWNSEEAVEYVSELWGRQLEKPDEAYLRVAVQRNEMVGYVIGKLVDPNLGGAKYVSSLGVVSSAQRQGIGTRLIEGFMKHPTDVPKPTYLHVFSGNQPALDFYNHLGFMNMRLLTPEKVGGYKTTRTLLLKKGATL